MSTTIQINQSGQHLPVLACDYCGSKIEDARKSGAVYLYSHEDIADSGAAAAVYIACGREHTMKLAERENLGEYKRAPLLHLLALMGDAAGIPNEFIWRRLVAEAHVHTHKVA